MIIISKNIYVGRPNDIKKSLFKIRNFSFENYNNDDLKLEIRLLYTVYIRYFIWKITGKPFFSQKHQLKDVEQWCLSMRIFKIGNIIILFLINK